MTRRHMKENPREPWDHWALKICKKRKPDNETYPGREPEGPDSLHLRQTSLLRAGGCASAADREDVLSAKTSYILLN